MNIFVALLLIGVDSSLFLCLFSIAIMSEKRTPREGELEFRAAVAAAGMKLVSGPDTTKVTITCSNQKLVDVWPDQGKFRPVRAKGGVPATQGSLSSALELALNIKAKMGL